MPGTQHPEQPRDHTRPLPQVDSSTSFQTLIYLATLSLSCTALAFLVTACGIYFPEQGSKPGPLHWEHGVLATGASEKSQQHHFLKH